MARTFDGTNDFFAGVNAPHVTGYPLTLSAWINPTSVTGALSILGVGETVNNGECCILIVNGSAWALSETIGGDNVQATSATSLSTGVTYHIAGVFASATSRLIYVNGYQDGSNATSRSPAAFTLVRIGQRASGSDQKFNGSIWSAAIHGVALSPFEIRELAAGKPPELVRSKSLANSWPLNDKGVSVRIDNGNFPNILSATGAPKWKPTKQLIDWPPYRSRRTLVGAAAAAAGAAGDTLLMMGV